MWIIIFNTQFAIAFGYLFSVFFRKIRCRCCCSCCIPFFLFSFSISDVLRFIDKTHWFLFKSVIKLNNNNVCSPMYLCASVQWAMSTMLNEMWLSRWLSFHQIVWCFYVCKTITNVFLILFFPFFYIYSGYQIITNATLNICKKFA